MNDNKPIQLEHDLSLGYGEMPQGKHHLKPLKSNRKTKRAEPRLNEPTQLTLPLIYY